MASEAFYIKVVAGQWRNIEVICAKHQPINSKQ